MRKKASALLNQLYLFNINEQIENPKNGNHLPTNQREQGNVLPEEERGNRVEIEPFKLGSDADLRLNENKPISKVPATTGERGTDRLHQQNDTTIFGENGTTSSEWLDGNRSEGGRMVEPLRNSGDSRFFTSDSFNPSTTLINFHQTENTSGTLSFNKKARFNDNISALEQLHKLEVEGRPANLEEQKILSKYVGFGGLKEILLNPQNNDQWNSSSDIDLKPLVEKTNNLFEELDPKGDFGMLLASKRSILSAFYTPYPVINAVWETIKNAGFKGGEVLEPSAGIGNFLAAMPINLADKSNVTAIEMDIASGKILSKLFPTVNSHINGFEKTVLPENSFDLILSNIPFGDMKVFDKQLKNNADKSFFDNSNSIQNFFFAKSIMLAKPGGMIGFITSRYSLDNQQNDGFRNMISDNCEFVGAIRLPDSTFKSNAGTEAVADLIFLRKFNIGEEKKQKFQFINTKSKDITDETGKKVLVIYNEYFHQNPTHMIGTVEFGGLYNKEGFNLKAKKGIDLFNEIINITKQLIPNPIINSQSESRNTNPFESLDVNKITPKSFQRVGNVVLLENGTTGIISNEFYINEKLDQKAKSIGILPSTLRNDTFSSHDLKNLNIAGLEINDFQQRVVVPIKSTKEDLKKWGFLEPLRDTVKELLYKELNNSSDYHLNILRGNLNEKYRDFTFRYGELSHPNNKKALSLDYDSFLIKSLEKTDKDTKKIIKSDIFFKRTINAVKEINHTENVSDAITISLQKFGKLQMNYICEILDKPYQELMANQFGKGSLIFKNEKGKHLTREDYLSGNVVDKLATAKQQLDLATEKQESIRWQSNIENLESVQPKKIQAVDIFSPINARWIPEKYIKDFLLEVLETKHFDLKFSKANDNYTIDIYENNPTTKAFATNRKSASWLIEHGLNGVEPIVKYTAENLEGKPVTLLDPEDTQLAKENYRRFKEKWGDWKFRDIERREDIASIYNTNFNNTVLRHFDGQHSEYPGLSGYQLRRHQQDTVFRNTQTLGGINDHMVGAGKTLIQIVTAMELKRLGLAKKPLIIGLKSQVPQLYNEFKKAYPLSNVLFPTDKDFSKDNRLQLLNNIATNDHDCIILSHDQFNMIKQPKEIQVKIINTLIDDLKTDFSNITDKQEIKRLEKRISNYETKLQVLQDIKKDDQAPDFGQLGIDYLMVDESQEFKNLEFNTQKRNIRGLGNPLGSRKAFNLLIACRHLQDIHGGDKGVLFCSGTPISNSMAELFLLFKYLTPKDLEKKGMQTFDRWASNFALDYSDLEYSMGKFKEVHRFREFANLPELVTMYRNVADVRNNTNLELEKPKAEHVLVKIEPSTNQLHHISLLQSFIETKGVQNAEFLGLTAGFDDKKGINPSFAIQAINYAKKLSMDPRMIDSTAEPGNKILEASENIFKIYNETSKFKGTQLVFSDIGTPKSNNPVENLYNHLEGDISNSDLESIFGQNFYDQIKKPDLLTIQGKIGLTLNLGPNEVNNLIKEASQSANFNVYSETKKLLVDKNISPEEIVFIHDYKTRLQKEKLYEQVNNGEIRIVIGSTKKLGTGVNVQERCTAAHHLDINWRPSDLEQRNGRLERQGNWAAKEFMDNQVKCFYYATERTLDASMYNTVSMKAAFIAQMKTSANPNVRTIKDIEEDIDMGSMAAELSGDPIFKEKATLTKRVTELYQLERSHKSKIFFIERNIDDDVRLSDALQKQIVILEKNIPLLAKIPMDEKGNHILSASVNGKKFDKLLDFGLAVLHEAEYQKSKIPIGKEVVIGEIWDFKVVAKPTYSMGDVEMLRKIVSPTGERIGDENRMPTTEMANALQIKNSIIEMDYQRISADKKREKALTNIQQYREQAKEPFPYISELEKKSKRLTVVNEIIINKINLELKKNNAEFTEQVSSTNNQKPSTTVDKEKNTCKIDLPENKNDNRNSIKR